MKAFDLAPGVFSAITLFAACAFTALGVGFNGWIGWARGFGFGWALIAGFCVMFGALMFFMHKME